MKEKSRKKIGKYLILILNAFRFFIVRIYSSRIQSTLQ